MDSWSIVNVLDYSNDNITKKFKLLSEEEFKTVLNKNEPIYILCNLSLYNSFDITLYDLVYSYKWFNSHIIDIYLIN